MKGGQKVAFGFVVLAGIAMCAALAFGKFSPPAEIASAPVATLPLQPIDIAPPATIRAIHHERRDVKASNIEEAEMLAANCVLHLIDTTSPMPVVNADR